MSEKEINHLDKSVCDYFEEVFTDIDKLIDGIEVMKLAWIQAANRIIDKRQDGKME